MTKQKLVAATFMVALKSKTADIRSVAELQHNEIENT